LFQPVQLKDVNQSWSILKDIDHTEDHEEKSESTTEGDGCSQLGGWPIEDRDWD